MILALSVCGCGEKKTSETDENTFTYWCSMDASTVSVYETYNDSPVYQYLEEKTGIHMDFIHPPTGQANEQFTLMLASKDYPDIIQASWVTYPGGQEKAISDKVIIPLNDIMKKYAPDCYKLITENESFDRYCKTNGGDYFMFPVLNGSGYNIFGGLVLRKDWLDELNLPVPETIEQWETTLRAFKEKKGATAPFTCQFAVMGSSHTNQAFNGAFEVGKRLYVDNGTVKFGPMEDAYKDWLSLMNKWYEEGLLDVEYGTNTSQAVLSKMSNGESGATFGFVGGIVGPLLQMNEGTDYDLAAAPYLTGADNVPHFAALEADVVDNGSVAVSTACRNPEKVAEWINYFYTEEGMRIRQFGIEGVSYDMVDGKPKFKDNVVKNPDGVSVMEMIKRNTFDGPGYTDKENADDYYDQFYPYERQKEAFKLWSEAAPSAREHLFPMISTRIEDAEEYSALNTEISTYVDEMVFKFVNGTEPIENFDKFRAALKKMNVERYIEINQNSYDLFLKR